MPILLCFVDLKLNQRDKVAGRAQALVIDDVMRILHSEGHSRAVPLIVPIDDGEFGNIDVRQLFGIHNHVLDTELSYYPHLVVYHQRDELYALIEPEDEYVARELAPMSEFERRKRMQDTSKLLDMNDKIK